MERRTTRKVKKQKRSPSPSKTCTLSTQAPALDYSSSLKKTDFYTWINEEWLKNTQIPTFENDYGISEEVEDCVYEKSKKILLDIKHSDVKKPELQMLKTLTESCLHSRSQLQSVDFLKRLMHTLECITTKEDVFRNLCELSALQFTSVLSLQYTIDDNSKIQLCIDGNSSSLPLSYYSDRQKVHSYKTLLHKIGEAFNVDNLEKVYTFEHMMVNKIEFLWSEKLTKTTGNGLVQKFSGIPWAIWFEEHNIFDWKTRTIYYRSPRWFRFLGKMLKEVPIETWKLYIARAYLIPSLQYLPPPYDEMDYEFFGKQAQGQKEKMPQMRLLVNIVYNYCTDIFSELFWEKEGSAEIEKSVKEFVNDIIQATKRRIENTKWLKEVTQNKAIRKIDAMRLEVVKPNTFPSYTPIELFHDNLLKNIFLLGKEKTKIIVNRADHPYRYWEEGIYRVNAYYFSENNEIMIPYGTTLPPFYSVKGSLAWNAGALGSIIGHEICHAFDEDGHLYDEKGNKSNWWKRSDKIAYNRKTKDLIKLYSKQKINEKKVNGKKTLSENIADLGGVGIALELVKEKYKDMLPEQRKKYLQEFFIAFAVSWRTRYRTEKLERALELDPHSPAFLRVNLVVSQFDEWYEAFDIDESSPSYRKPEDRIRIF